MSHISEIDKNFKVETKLNKQDIVFYDTKKEPFEIYGVFFEGDRYRRMPADIAKTVSYGVNKLHTNTAGGRVKFKTDSQYIAISAKMPEVSKMPHFAFSGSIGFDLYVYEKEERFVKSYVPPIDVTDGFEGIIEFETREMREVTINFPLYSDLEDLYIGVSADAQILSPRKYRDLKPIVYYGSSITQGACATRPGNCYQAIISRRFNVDYINLGFSGNAFAEENIAQYIKNLDMSVFVYDYDHNSPHAEFLKNTHEKMFKTIREANPDLPIILLSRPKCNLTQEEKKRLEVVKTTYNNAVQSGDKNVYLIKGYELMALSGDDGIIDSCHPNDYGFYSMAEAICNVLRKII